MTESRSVFGKRSFKTRQCGSRNLFRLWRCRHDGHGQSSVLGSERDARTIQYGRLQRNADFAFALHERWNKLYFADDGLDNTVDGFDNLLCACRYGLRYGGFANDLRRDDSLCRDRLDYDMLRCLNRIPFDIRLRHVNWRLRRADWRALRDRRRRF